MDTYLGQEYEVGLELAYDLDPEVHPIPAELRDHLQSEPIELPEGIQTIRVSYDAELSINIKRAIGWKVMRFYDIEYVMEPSDGFSPEADEDDDSEYHAVSNMRVAKLLEKRIIPMFSDPTTPDGDTADLEALQEVSDLAYADDHTFAAVIDDLLERFNQPILEQSTAVPGEQLSRSMYFRHLTSLALRLLQDRDHRTLELAEFFPADVMDAITAQ